MLLGLGETHLDAPDIARRRGDLPQERRMFAAREFLLADLGGPFGDFLAPLVPERDHYCRHVDGGGGKIHTVALLFEHVLPALAGPAIAHAFEAEAVRSDRRA